MVSQGGKMEIRLEKPALNNFKAYSLLIVNHFMESKIIEYKIILLHKYMVEQTEQISRFLFACLLTNFKNIGIFP